MATSVLVRAKLTAAEWLMIRKLALDLNTPVSKLVADTLRESLLKGAKP